MAEVITRFKLETTQYDSKLRDAANGLKELTHQASIAGSEFGKFTQKNVDAARAFGNIATSATNSKDKVKELVGAFNQVARSYNALTKEQQQSDFGKALAESMQTLKGRIKEAKEEMNSTGGILGQLKDKFAITLDATKLFNAGVMAAKAALDVAKDAFFASEATVDEWGRTVASAQGLYEGFLNAINNGDISGYLSRMDDIVRAARAAYDEMDRLQTMRTIQAPGMSAQQTENERMRQMLQTGHYIAPIDGRRASMKDGQVLTPEQMKTIERQLQGGMQKMVGMVGNEVKQTGRAIDAYYNSLAKQNGMSLREFRSGTSSWESFSRMMAGYEQYKAWDRQARTEFAKQGGRGYVNFDANNPYAQFRKWGTFRVDKMEGNSYNELVNLIKQRDQQASQTYGMMAQSYRTMNRVNGVTVKGIMGGGGGGRTGGTEITYAADSITAMEKEVSELTKLWKDASAAVRDEYAAQLDEAKLRLDSIIGKNKSIIFDSEQAAKQIEVSMGKNTAQTSGLGNIMSTFDIGSGLSTDQLKSVNGWMQELVKTANQQKLAFNAAGQAAVNFGAALSGLEDPAAKAAGTVIQAIANIVLGFSSAAAQASSMGPYGWIAYLAAGLAATATTISTIHSLTGYAEGGMVGADGRSGGMISGNTYSSDQIPIMANAGEIILNRAQQSTLAASLQGVGGNLNLHGVLTGENIFVAADRYAQRSGKGEIVTWK